MKKLTTVFICVFALFTTMACADNEKPIQASQLPVFAQQFIRQYFPDRKVMLAKVETEILSKNYEVFFENGDRIEFDGKGNWTEVDCKFSSVPTAVIPDTIVQYIKENYPETTVVKIEKDRKEYEVKLSNRMELKFDSKYDLIDIDL